MYIEVEMAGSVSMELKNKKCEGNNRIKANSVDLEENKGGSNVFSTIVLSILKSVVVVF